MLDPGERAVGFEQSHERGAFERQDLILGHDVDEVRRSAGQHFGEFDEFFGRFSFRRVALGRR